MEDARPSARSPNLNLLTRRALRYETDARVPPQSPATSLSSLSRIDTISARGSGLLSPNRTSYSDRFIPSRSGSNLSGFELIDKSPAGLNFPQINDSREDAAAAYSMLLRTELFGMDSGPLSPATPERMNSLIPRDPRQGPLSPRNLLRFKNDRQSGAHVKPESPFSLSPVGLDGALAGSITSPRKTPRKIARSPYKVSISSLVLYHLHQSALEDRRTSVSCGFFCYLRSPHGPSIVVAISNQVLDAPALQDDFYLNLVDWSSHNVLAVGLGTCVYLWSACTSQASDS